jgi:hypothetical protein
VKVEEVRSIGRKPRNKKKERRMSVSAKRGDQYAGKSKEKDEQ